MNCPKCSSRKHLIKSGKIKGKQRYKCKRCNYHFTRVTPKGYPKSIKRMALYLYLEGIGFRSIERILGPSNVTILRWIRDLGIKVEGLVKNKANQTGKKVIIKHMELDEMWHYIGKKNEKSGYGWQLIELVNNLYHGYLVLGPQEQPDGSGKV
jgi:transposase-like protein